MMENGKGLDEFVCIKHGFSRVLTKNIPLSTKVDKPQKEDYLLFVENNSCAVCFTPDKKMMYFDQWDYGNYSQMASDNASCQP